MTQLNITAEDERKRGQTSLLVEQAINRERKILQLALAQSQEHLQELEKKYSLSSVLFFQRYKNGLAEDDDDSVNWAGEYQIYLSLQQQLLDLEDVVVCS